MSRRHSSRFLPRLLQPFGGHAGRLNQGPSYLYRSVDGGSRIVPRWRLRSTATRRSHPYLGPAREIVVLFPSSPCCWPNAL